GIDDAAAFRARTEDAELTAFLLGEALDGLRFVAAAGHIRVFEPREPGQDAVALSERRLPAAPHRSTAREDEHAGAIAFTLLPYGRLADQVAVGVARHD